MFDAFQRIIEQVQGTVFETAIQPALFHLGLMDWSEDVFDGVEFALYGALAVALAYILFRPLELWRPVENRDIQRRLQDALQLQPPIVIPPLCKRRPRSLGRRDVLRQRADRSRRAGADPGQ